MVHILRHPSLPDPFVIGDGERSHVADYERGAAIVLPNMADRIDTAFWSSIDVDAVPALKKFGVGFGPDAPPGRQRIVEALVAAMVAPDLADQMADRIIDLHGAVMPLYRRVFAGYRFPKTKAVFRLNTIRAENVHFDTYREPLPDHFARMFINLDDRPRIWHLSWPIHAAMERHGALLGDDALGRDANSVWNELSWSLFGKSSRQCWDGEPRHIAFFDPGDVWIVDSRQQSHQIFYGRRAVSIDFTVDPASMQDPGAHYLAIAEAFRRREILRRGLSPADRDKPG